MASSSAAAQYKAEQSRKEIASVAKKAQAEGEAQQNRPKEENVIAQQTKSYQRKSFISC